jgi:hypothetical protein
VFLRRKAGKRLSGCLALRSGSGWGIQALDDIAALTTKYTGIVARSWPYLSAKLPPEEE